MTEAELVALFRLAEADRVERKESNASPDRIRQAICAHANDLPNHRQTGVIFVGQRDDLTCAGLHVDDQLLQRLAGYRSEGLILPFPTMAVRRVTLDGCQVAVIEVEPSDNPPVRFEGRVWIRVGPRRAIATAEEERRLVEKRRWGNLPYDAHAVRGAMLDDLDLRRFQLEYLPVAFSPEALAQNHYRNPTLAEAMKSMGFIERFGIGIAIARERLAANGNHLQSLPWRMHTSW